MISEREHVHPIVVEAPRLLLEREIIRPAIFLAGGITGCPNWQKETIELLAEQRWRGTVFNPRRENFPIGDPTAAAGQIAWEHTHLRRADVILFWFPACDSVQPIALFELGVWSSKHVKISVGMEHGYLRQVDVLHQMRLEDIPVRSTLADTVFEAMAFADEGWEVGDDG